MKTGNCHPFYNTLLNVKETDERSDWKISSMSDACFSEVSSSYKNDIYS